MESIFETRNSVILDIICVNSTAKMLLNIDTVWAFIKINSIPDEEKFSETAVVRNATYFIKILGYSH